MGVIAKGSITLANDPVTAQLIRDADSDTQAAVGEIVGPLVAANPTIISAASTAAVNAVNAANIPGQVSVTLTNQIASAGLIGGASVPDPTAALAYGITDAAGHRSWVEITTAGGPSQHAVDLMGAAGVQSAATIDPGTASDVAFSIVDSQRRRSWLEIARSGGPTQHTLDMLIAAGLGGGGSGPTISGVPIVSLNSDVASKKEYPVASTPVTGATLAFADQSAISIYWPCLVDLSLSGGSGVLMVYSTDHAATHTDSGMFALWAPNVIALADPVQRINRGRIFRDDNSGFQCETPSVIWNEVTSLYHVYYQMAHPDGAVADQVTLLATSPDMVTFTRVGIVLDVPQSPSIVPGDYRHQGYFAPFRYGGAWYGFNVGGGTSGAMKAWASQDGITWTYTHRLAMGGPYISHLNGYDPTAQILKWTWTNIISWRGELWLIGAVGAEAAGLDVPGSFKVAVGKLSNDMARPASVLKDVSPATQSWETTPRDSIGRGASVGGRYFIPYRSNGPQGGFGILELK